MTYIIRRMIKDDLAQVNQIDREAFPTQWPPANYLQELQNKLAHYIVVYDDTMTCEDPGPATGKREGGPFSWILRLFGRRSAQSPSPNDTQQYIVGFSGIWVLTDEAHITNIAVRQQYQGRGLGELLMIATIDLAAHLGCGIMTLEVRVSNTIAQRLYIKYGFTQVGTRRGYYLDNREDAVIMSTENINSTAFRSRSRQLREDLIKKLPRLGSGQSYDPPANS